MFKIEKKLADNFNIVILTDSCKDCVIEILPSCGAILHSFTIPYQQGEINVIDHYQSKEDFDVNVTAHGFKSCKMAPFACRIKDAVYEFDGKKYRLEKYLLGTSAIHGLIYDRAFTLISTHADETGAEAVMQYEYRGEEKGYPFHFDCIVSYRLQADNKLIISTTMVNKDAMPIPMQDGWHPYFTLGKKVDELELTMKTTRHLTFSEELIPTGETTPYTEFNQPGKISTRSFDDCYLVDETITGPACIVRDPETGLQVAITPDKTYPYLQVYTPPHRNSIAIENLSAPPNAFNNQINLLILQPQEATTFTTSYTVTV